MKISRLTRASLSTLVAPISWGTTYITISELLPGDRPLFVATMRVVPAGIALLLAGRLSSRWRPHGVEWRQLATIALFSFGLFFPLLITAAYRLPGGVAASASGLQPLLVILLSLLIAGERPRRLDVLVGMAAAMGVALVVLRPGAGVDPIGIAAAAGGNISFATGIVLMKRYPTPENRLGAIGWEMLMSAAILVPLTLATEGLPSSLTTTNWAGFAYLSLFATGLTFVLWFNGIQRLPVAGPPLLGLAVPITGAALGWALLNQSLTAVQLAGFAVTIAAISYGATLGNARFRLTSRSHGTTHPTGTGRSDPHPQGAAHGVAHPGSSRRRRCRL